MLGKRAAQGFRDSSDNLRDEIMNKSIGTASPRFTNDSDEKELIEVSKAHKRVKK